MSTYIALLRGINVSGHKIIKMEDLRDSLKALRFEDVKTYVQSGNVVFKTSEKSAEKLSKKIEKRISDSFGFSVLVVVKSSKEIQKVIKSNPFLKDQSIDSSQLYVTFLSKTPTKEAIKALDGISGKPDQFHYYGKEIYLYCPNGYGNTKLSVSTFERLLLVGATARNWNTVNKLLEMSST